MNISIIKQEENFNNYFNKINIDINPVSTNIKIEEEEDSKLPAVENFWQINSFVQADWGHMINQDNIINSRTELRRYTSEERFLLTHFDPCTENCTSGDSTPEFILTGDYYYIPADIWVQVRASCECLILRVIPLLTISTSDLEEEHLYCSIIILVDTSLTIHQGFPTEFIKENSKWNIPGQVKVDKVTFEQARFELWIYYHTCLQHDFNISYLLECIEAVDLDTLYL